MSANKDFLTLHIRNKTYHILKHCPLPQLKIKYNSTISVKYEYGSRIV